MLQYNSDLRESHMQSCWKYTDMGTGLRYVMINTENRQTRERKGNERFKSRKKKLYYAMKHTHFIPIATG